jgi:hypothetical protein
MGDRDSTDADPRLARIVADADVLAADLLVGGAARAALDHWRRHSWVNLVVTERLLDDAAAVVTALAHGTLAADWRTLLEARATVVDADTGVAGHPALVAAVSGEAVHVLSFDDGLRNARAGAALQPYVDASVKAPDGFARLFDPAAVYAAAVGGEYPGPDRDPRA